MKDLISEYGSFIFIIMMGTAVVRMLGLMLHVLTTCHWAA